MMGQKKEHRCAECEALVPVIFTNSDGKERCAGCAVDKYLSSPGSQVYFKGKPLGSAS